MNQDDNVQNINGKKNLFRSYLSNFNNNFFYIL